MEEETKEEKWNLAENLNQANGTEASPYLKELINEEIEGEINTEEIIERLKEHYDENTRTNR